MGQAYVEKMLEWYTVDSRAFLFYLEAGGRCIGYCGGMTLNGASAAGSASSMIQHSFGSAVKALTLRPWLFVHPEFLKKYRLILRNVSKRLRRWLGIPIEPNVRAGGITPHAGLVVVGVDPEFQGRGYGSKLIAQFESESLARGFQHVMLTVLADNHQAIRAYERNGWTVVSRSGRSVSMEKVLG
jgi:ribosomal protein S18 acetylase RimI-like enzyme